MGSTDIHTSVMSSDYLAIAKDMVPGVCDEADLDSVRALILLVGVPDRLILIFLTLTRHWLYKDIASLTMRICMLDWQPEWHFLLDFMLTNTPCHMVLSTQSTREPFGGLFTMSTRR